jgi:hypothetical protein
MLSSPPYVYDICQYPECENEAEETVWIRNNYSYIALCKDHLEEYEMCVERMQDET